MEDFIQGEDYKLWDIVTIGLTIPIKTVKGVQVPKIWSEVTPDDLVALRKNTREKTFWYVG